MHEPWRLMTVAEAKDIFARRADGTRSIIARYSLQGHGIRFSMVDKIRKCSSVAEVVALQKAGRLKVRI